MPGMPPSPRPESLGLSAHRDVAMAAHVVDATLWHASGDSPQLVVARHVPASIAQRVLFELDIVVASGRHAAPALGFDFGDGFAGSVPLAPAHGSPKPWAAVVDLQATPLRIRIEPGCGAAPFLCSELRATPLGAVAADTPRVAAIAHLSRRELWPELAQYLGNIPGLRRLYLCLAEDARDFDAEIRRRYPQAVVRHVATEDGAAATLEMVNIAIDQGIDLACLVHDRPAAHLQGLDAARWDMAHKVLGSGAIVESIVRRFAADRSLGIVVPAGHLLPAADGSHPAIPGGVCWARTEALASTLAIEGASRGAAARGFTTLETGVPDSASPTALDFAPADTVTQLRSRIAPGTGKSRALTLTALAGLEPVDATRGEWRALHNDPQFAVDGIVEHAGGWVAVTLAQQSRYAAGLPTLHFDFGDGWTSDSAAVLRRPAEDGHALETVCFIPPGVKRARFDPIAFPGTFTLAGLALRPLLAIEAAASMAAALGEASGASLALARLFPAYRASLETMDSSYASWLAHYDIPAAQHESLRLRQSTWPDPPLVSIFAATSDAAALAPLAASLRAQVYPHWELLQAPATQGLAAAVNAALANARGRLFAIARPGDALHPLALHFVARAAVENPDVALVYTDEDRIDADGARRDPWFKCEPNAELLLACDMFSSLACYSTQVLRGAGGLREGFEGAERHDLALRVVVAVDRTQVLHVPRVLYHRGAVRGDIADSAIEAARRAVAAHLARTGSGGDVAPAPNATPGTMRVRFAIPDPAPSVAIVIPTRDHAELLRTCVDSLRSRTRYPAYSIVIVDNGSREAEAVDLIAGYERDGIAIMRDDSQFNYAALNNRAVAASEAEFACLLNNDIEVLSPDWLAEMVGMADRPGVGAVGARLWYPDRTLQHGGIVIGIAGYAGHAHRHLPQGTPGYADRAILHQQFTAVTGACLLVRKATYEAVGGLDEQLPVAYNDVDFCLRLFDAGYRNVWTPYAQLVHHESATRGAESTPEKVRRLQADMKLLRERWGARLFDDPAYSPNLTLDAEDFSLAWPPRVDDSP